VIKNMLGYQKVMYKLKSRIPNKIKIKVTIHNTIAGIKSDSWPFKRGKTMTTEGMEIIPIDTKKIKNKGIHNRILNKVGML
jgi:hypothetical protein